MHIAETPLPGCFTLQPKLIEDPRGYFFESFHQRKFREQTGLDLRFVQDNQSRSRYGVLRGLHLQKGDRAQAKLVRVLSGRILDVAVDLRPDSKTYKQYFSIGLSGENRTQLFIPRGFAHGFVTLSPQAEVHYKCDTYYDGHSALGIRYDDEQLNIDWQIDRAAILQSERDRQNLSFEQWERTIG